MKLTYNACKNAKPTDKPRKLSDGGGLYLEVMPNGSKYWRLKYRVNNKEKRLAIGVFPAISLAEAREERDRAKKYLQKEVIHLKRSVWRNWFRILIRKIILKLLPENGMRNKPNAGPPIIQNL